MSGVLNVDTIADNAGTGPVTLTKQSAAKAYVDKNSIGTTINDSFNISSLDDDGVGDFGINYTNSLASANYAVSGITDDNTTSVVTVNMDTTNGTNASGSIDLEVYYVNSTSNRTNYDSRSYVVIHGDLA